MEITEVLKRPINIAIYGYADNIRSDFTMSIYSDIKSTWKGLFNLYYLNIK